MTPEEFLHLHSGKEFPHRDEVLQALSVQKGPLKDPGNNVPCRRLLNIYGQRANHLKKFTTAHAITLRSDSEALCQKLEASEEPNCQIWSINSGIVNFVLFIGSTSGRVFGCLRTIGQTSVDETTWKELWGE